MKISKLVRLILVMFVAVGLVAPQQAQAVPSRISFDVLATITSSGGETTFSPIGGLTTVDIVDGVFQDLFGATGPVKSFTWTGSDSSVVLLNAPIIDEWVVSNSSGQARFDLRRLTSVTLTSSDQFINLTIRGKGTVSAVTDSTTLPPTPATIVFDLASLIDDGVNFEGPVETVPTPDSGSALGLLAVVLVALEGLRRKITAVQSR
jgi:hypothetical protein